MNGAPPGQMMLRVIEGGLSCRSWHSAPVVEPDMPEWLSGEARAIWAELVPVLAARGIVGRADRATFGTFCQIAAERLAVREKLARLGPVQALVDEHSELEQQLVQWCARFELPPIIKRRFVRDGDGVIAELTEGGEEAQAPRAG